MTTSPLFIPKLTLEFGKERRWPGTEVPDIPIVPIVACFAASSVSTAEIEYVVAASVLSALAASTSVFVIIGGGLWSQEGVGCVHFRFRVGGGLWSQGCQLRNECTRFYFCYAWGHGL